ncbi:response regulator [Desulfovibrio sp. OttesenSCG-928-M14]|nr:response regulator [Desulfovibrio sp. OttesenSCG-928-M14]
MNSQGEIDTALATISDDALKELFLKMDIQIMVADLETYEILYANEKMNAAYNIDYDPTGKLCWETYHRDQNGPCDFCPMKNLKRDSLQSIEWDVYSPVTERWFHNVSSVIRWNDGRPVHFEQGMDITNVREKDAELREAEAYTQMMLDSTPLSCSVWDEEGNLLDTNQETTRLFHLQDKSEYINNFFAFNPTLQPDGKSSRKKAIQMVRKAFATGYARFEWEFRIQGNKSLPTEIMLVRVPFKNGFRVLSYARDLREIKKADVAVRQYTNLLQAASDMAVTMLSISFKNFDDILTNQLKILGEAAGLNRVCIWENCMRDNVLHHRLIYRWSVDEMRAQNILPLYHELNYDDFPEHKKTLMASKTVNRRVADMSGAEREFFKSLDIKAILLIPIIYNDEFWGFISFDNCVEETLPSDINVSVLRTNGIVLASSIVRDRSKKALLASGQKLERNGKLLGAVNHVAENLIAGDPFDFTQVMQECLEILGRSVGANRVSLWRNFENKNGQLCSRRLPGWLEGKSLTQACYEREIDFATFIPEWDKGVTTRKDINMPLKQLSRAIRNSGVMHHTKALLLMPVEVNGEFWGFMAYSFEDEDRQLGKTEIGILRSGGTMIASAIMQNDVNQKLLLATEEALTSIRAKNEFMARMSHEIRTPMNAVIGMTAIARAAPTVERKDYCLDKIDGASTHLLGIINDILDMSKIDADKLELSPVAFRFDDLIRDSVACVRLKAEEKQQRCSVDVGEGIPPVLIGDVQRLRQVLVNLLGNAVKFTPEHGEVELRARFVGENAVGCLVRFEVQDTGIGISEEQKPSLFDAFEQAENSTSRKFGGTGLGLSISRHITHMMGGNIEVESEIGKGSLFAFTVTLPRGEEAPPEPSPAKTIKAVDLQGFCILLAEDVHINREIVLAILEPTGIIVDCAENGVQAVEMFRDNAKRYDLIFMDVQMPEMDGYEATRHIRAMTVPNAASIPIVAMTANAFREDVEKCLAAGMNGHVSKPLDFDEVMDTLRMYLEKR